MGPMLAAMQLGSAVGHLARSHLGAYELPIPRPRTRLLVVPANVTRFAEDWSLDLDEVRLWVCLREVTSARRAVAHRTWRRACASSWCGVVQGMAEDTAGLVERLQGARPRPTRGPAEPARRPRPPDGLEPSPAPPARRR